MCRNAQQPNFRCSYYDVYSSWISWIYLDKPYYFQLNFSKMVTNENNRDRNILIQQKFPIRFQCINNFLLKPQVFDALLYN